MSAGLEFAGPAQCLPFPSYMYVVGVARCHTSGPQRISTSSSTSPQPPRHLGAVVLGLPLSVLLIKGLPQPVAGDPHFGAYAGVLLLMGLLVSWCGCNNSALFADLVPEQLRSTIYAFDRSFEVRGQGFFF